MKLCSEQSQEKMNSSFLLIIQSWIVQGIKTLVIKI